MMSGALLHQLRTSRVTLFYIVRSIILRDVLLSDHKLSHVIATKYTIPIQACVNLLKGQSVAPMRTLVLRIV